MPLIVGNAVDPHVQAVIAAMVTEPVLIDAATILDSPVTITADAVEICRRKVSPGAGWLRRLAPEGWTESINAPGVDAVSRAAAVSALAAIARDERFTWLTKLDQLGGSENKPYQYRRAAAAGVPVPEWVVTTDRDAVPSAGAWVAKALGPGSFIDDTGAGRVVPTRNVDTADRETIARVPFILQRRVDARSHARVITVGRAVWSATLPAADLPLDWRTSAAGHHGFTPASAPERVHRLALAAAASTAVGYSAQDWIQDNAGSWWFVDLNPAGQWLFLPSPVAVKVTEAIAHHLDEER
jgi:hypothetical protein